MASLGRRLIHIVVLIPGEHACNEVHSYTHARTHAHTHTHAHTTSALMGLNNTAPGILFTTTGMCTDGILQTTKQQIGILCNKVV